MSLHLHFSNRLEPLVSELSGVLDEHWTDFGAPPPVVPPSPAVAKWLKLRLCERRGALVGLPTPTLESFLWKALDPDPGMKILRADALQQAMIPLLDKNRLEREEYAPVREYLCPRGSIDVRRRYQLAQAMARLFLEYEYNRPSVWKDGVWAVKGVDQVWPRRSYFAKVGESESAAEIWQRDLHGDVFAAGGPLTESGRLGLPRLHRLRREAGWEPAGSAVMVFGVEKVSHFHRNLLMELSQGRELHLFLVNPCSEFWEDVDTSRRPRRRSFKLPRFSANDYQADELSASLYPAGSPDRAADPLLLQRWGRTPRESLSLWSQAVDYDFDLLVDQPISQGATISVLGVLQQAIVQRHPGPAAKEMELEDGRILSGPVPPDDSVLLLDCPERAREMESVRDQIVQWLSEDKSRMVSDVVVLLPDPAKHRAAIHRVFGASVPGEPGHLPWVMLGESAGESQWARAVHALFALAKGQCDRPSVFGLLRNRLVQARLKIDAATVARWESWAELSGMIRGWDAEHRLEMGDAPEVGLDTHTFRAGMMRLMLAPVADREFALGMRVATGLQERVPVARDFESEPSEVQRFATCVETLFHDVRSLCKQCRILSPSALAKVFATLLDSWIGFDDEGESRVRRELLEGLELLGIQEAAGCERISLEELEESVKSLLDGELPASARAFAGSLTFAPLKSGHVLPHGMVVLAGFDSSAFPGDGMRTRLDLLAGAPLVGDADAVRDNRALFLQALLSARSRLVVTWKGRDVQKDEKLEPSSVVLELEEALGSVVGKICRVKVRLLARDAVLPDEDKDPDAALVSWDPSDRIDPRPPAREPWKRETQAGDGSVRVTISDLKSYLTDSFLHHARRTMGWQDDEAPDTLDAAQEAIATTPLHDAIWRTELLPQIADLVWSQGFQAIQVDALVRRFVESKSWDASFPEAVLAAAELEALLAWGRSLAAQLGKTREEFPSHRLACGADLSLGIPGRSSTLELRVDGRKVLLAQRIACVLVPSAPTDPVVLLECTGLNATKTKPSTVDRSKSFGAKLQSAVLGLVGKGQPVRIRFFAREPDAKPADETGLVVGREWFETVVGDLLRDECQFLPGKTILDAKPKDMNLVSLREKIEGAEHPDPLQELFDPTLPGEDEKDDDTLQSLARRRLGPFLEADHGA